MTETPRPGDQPLPTPTDGPGMHDLVIADLDPVDYRRLVVELRKRRNIGLKRYGSLLQAHNGRDALRDLVEECLDGVVYARQVREEAVGWADREAAREVERNLLSAAQFAIALLDGRKKT